MRKNEILYLLLFIFFSIATNAQEHQYILKNNNSEVSVLVDKNLKSRLKPERKMGTVFIEGQMYKLGINMDTVGVWSLNEDGSETWKLKINVPTAKAFFITFDDFYLPQGSKLYVYNKDNIQKPMLFLNEDNPEGGPYSVEDITGDEVILEYVSTEIGKDHPRFTLSKVGYKYLDNQKENLDGFNSGLNKCMININCPQGDDWQVQKKGIVRLRIETKTGVGLCSGSLINNTNNDKTPYILTAWHCFEYATTEEEIRNTHFFFEYESPNCDVVRPSYRYHKGAVKLVLNSLHTGSDGALLKLDQPIPDYWDVYFNGWDRSNDGNKFVNGAIIHHPRGDIKKISFYKDPLRQGRFNDFPGPNTHWIAKYSAATTEEGSSGSSIFSGDKLIVGTLTGGAGSCANLAAPDYYGKLWSHWDQLPEYSMKQYLDPKNTGEMQLMGLSNIDGVPELKLNESIIDVLVNYSKEIEILSGNGGYTLIVDDPSIAKARVDGNKIIIDALSKGSTIVKVTDKYSKKAELTVNTQRDIELYLTADKNLEVALYKEDDKLKQIKLHDFSGNTVYRSPVLENIQRQQINIGILQTGAYIVEIETEKGISRKIKVQW